MKLTHDVNLLAYLRARKIKLVHKRASWINRLIGWLLRVLTGNERYFSSQTTTMWPRRIYYNDKLHAKWTKIKDKHENSVLGQLDLGTAILRTRFWDQDLSGVLESIRPTMIHEFRHERDAFWMGPLFQITYLLLLIPVLLSFGRVWLELRAYKYNIAHWPGRYAKAEACPPKTGALDDRRESALAWVAESLWSVYAWPLPRPWTRWMGRRMVKKYMKKKGML